MNLISEYRIPIALLTVHDMSHLTVTRQASMADVAVELDISVSALGERFQRAYAHLIEHFIHSNSYKTPENWSTD